MNKRCLPTVPPAGSPHRPSCCAPFWWSENRKYPSFSCVLKTKKIYGETINETWHIITLFYLKLFSHFRYRKDMKQIQHESKLWKKTRWSKDSRVRPVRPWGQWTPGAQWYLAGIHHSLCSWTSRRGTAEAGWSCTHHTRNARNKYTFSCQNSSDSHRRSMCPKGNWNIWSLWTQIGCTLLVDL